MNYKQKNEIVFLLYRCDAWMSTASMKLIGVYNDDAALADAVRNELTEISYGDDFNPAEWDVRKCFGKWVKKEIEEARQQQIKKWMDYFFDYDQTPNLRANLYLEAWTLNEAA